MMWTRTCWQRFSEVQVLLVSAMTICGRISPAGHGSLLDRRRLEELRDRTGASLMGANTLRSENPEMRATDGVLRPERLRAVITRSGDIPVEGKKLFSSGPKPVIFTGEKTLLRLKRNLQEKGRVVALPETANGLSLQSACEFFAGMKVDSLLLEGGAQLNYSALAAGLVDEIFLTVLPDISGDRNSPSFADGPGPLGDPFLGLELVSTRPVSTGEIFLHYRVTD